MLAAVEIVGRYGYKMTAVVVDFCVNYWHSGVLLFLLVFWLLFRKNGTKKKGKIQTCSFYLILGNTPDTVRSKLIYCIRRNYDALRAAVQRTYRYDMGEFYGIKAFIDQVSFVFDSFARK